MVFTLILLAESANLRRRPASPFQDLGSCVTVLSVSDLWAGQRPGRLSVILSQQRVTEFGLNVFLKQTVEKASVGKRTISHRAVPTCAPEAGMPPRQCRRRPSDRPAAEGFLSSLQLNHTALPRSASELEMAVLHGWVKSVLVQFSRVQTILCAPPLLSWTDTETHTLTHTRMQVHTHRHTGTHIPHPHTQIHTHACRCTHTQRRTHRHTHSDTHTLRQMHAQTS